MSESLTPNEQIVRIEKSILRGPRPRSIGYNARIGTHGPRIVDSVVRIEVANGAWGLGWSNIGREEAEALIGRKTGELFHLPEGSLPAGRPIDPTAVGPDCAPDAPTAV